VEIGQKIGSPDLSQIWFVHFTLGPRVTKSTLNIKTHTMYEAQFLETDGLKGTYLFEATCRIEARRKAKQVQKAQGYGVLLRLSKVKPA
jgi:hypothetical protein